MILEGLRGFLRKCNGFLKDFKKNSWKSFAIVKLFKFNIHILRVFKRIWGLCFKNLWRFISSKTWGVFWESKIFKKQMYGAANDFVILGRENELLFLNCKQKNRLSATVGFHPLDYSWTITWPKIHSLQDPSKTSSTNGNNWIQRLDSFPNNLIFSSNIPIFYPILWFFLK
jgi:hypothetical protein